MAKSLFSLGNFSVNINDRDDLIKKIILSTRHKKKPTIFYYLNSASYYLFESNPDFKNSFEKNDYVYLNSFYLGLVLKALYKKSPEKINAEDFFPGLMTISRVKKLKVFLLGGRSKTLKKAVDNVRSRYKNILLGGFSGYFKTDRQAVKKIALFSPDILIVGLGSGYQEAWINKNVRLLRNVKSIITVGNFIDILGGEKKLPPDFFKKNKLEWLYRLIKEPKRLSKRYFFGGFVILKIFFMNLFNFRYRKVPKVKSVG